MEESKNQSEIKEYPKHKTIHHILAYSYFMYFVLLLIGLVLDYFYPVDIIDNDLIKIVAVVSLFFSSLLILWAQMSSGRLEKEGLVKESFMKGPYKYTRMPTHWGVFILSLSFGILYEGFFAIVFILIALFLTKKYFIKKEEELLEYKYGSPYLEYKKSVKI